MRVFPLLVTALLLAGCGGESASAPKPSFPKPAPSTFRGISVPATKAPAIALHDDAGKPVSLASQHGWTLVTFLYTHCPDVCPLIAANLNRALQQVDDVSVLAVSVDPKGDTPAAVRAYVKQKHLVPRFHYLLGTLGQLRPIWARYHVAAQTPGGGVVSHVAYTVLIDPHGKERLIYDAQVKAAMVVHDLRVLMHT
ncbi:MAG TPA: SCO family protein [Gaiellaceae bacterium]|nr:SCO family protein [Gaiellaceae bacterium]